MLELDGVLERKDASLDLLLVDTADHHLVVSQIQTPGDVLEVLLTEDPAEHEDVARVLAAFHRDWSAH